MAVLHSRAVRTRTDHVEQDRTAAGIRGVYVTSLDQFSSSAFAVFSLDFCTIRFT